MKQGKSIGYELESRREHRRVIMPPIQIDIEGVEYTTVDWSLGGASENSPESSPRNQRIVAGRRDGTVHIWTLPPNRE